MNSKKGKLTNKLKTYPLKNIWGEKYIILYFCVVDATASASVWPPSGGQRFFSLKRWF